LTRPDLVIDNKGRYIYNKFLSFSKRSEAWKHLRQTIDSSSISFKVGSAGETFVFLLQLFNDGDEGQTYKLRRYESLFKPTGAAWSSELRYNGSAVSFPYSITLAKRSSANFELRITAPATITYSGEIGSVTILAEEEDNEESTDLVRGVAIINPVAYTDILKEIEHLAEDEGLFPSGSTYGSQASIESMILHECNSIYGKCLSALDGIRFGYTDEVKNFIIYRIVARLLQKSAAYSLDGGVLYARVIDKYIKRADRLENEIIAGCL